MVFGTSGFRGPSPVDPSPLATHVKQICNLGFKMYKDFKLDYQTGLIKVSFCHFRQLAKVKQFLTFVLFLFFFLLIQYFVAAVVVSKYFTSKVVVEEEKKAGLLINIFFMM